MIAAPGLDPPDVLWMATRAENKTARREALLASARKLYAKSGVENVSMEDVARDAGCTRRTLYAYFESWDDLCIHVFVEGVGLRWQHQVEAMNAVTGAEAKLKAWGESYWEYAKLHPEILHLQSFIDYRHVDLANVGPDARHQYRSTIDPVVEEMRATFNTGQMDGSLRAELDADSCLSQYAHALRAVMNRVLFPGESFVRHEPDPFVLGFIDLFLGSLLTPKEKSR
jgi:AcrR family transcriptional regulator